MTGSMVIGSVLVAPLAQASVSRAPSHVMGAKQSRVAFTLTMEDQLLAYLRYLPVSFYVKVKVKTSVPTTTTVPDSTTTTLSSSTTTTSTTTTTVAWITKTITTTALKHPTTPQP
ncbi:MAG TPA: hypothetical protein VII84_05070, partial [Acidimicrobiales bacterium]